MNPPLYRYFFVFLLLFSLLPIHDAAATQPLPIIESGHKNKKNSLSKPYIVLVSFDGFRYDYIDKYGAKNFKTIEAGGCFAESLIPSFPTKTFPNHYSIVTGLVPTHHGIIDNQFFDSSNGKTYSLSDPFAVQDGNWYKGTPLWVLAEEQGLLSASFFWVGSEAAIKNIRPSYYLKYDSTISNERRVKQIADWLSLPQETRPHLIFLYFSLVDNNGHDFGPDSQELQKSVVEADQLIGDLNRKLEETKLPINLILVSDHGMAKIDTTKIIRLYEHFNVNDFEVSGSGTFVSLYSKDKKKLQNAYTKLKSIKNITVYWKQNIPPKYQIDSTSRLGDIVILADFPAYILTKPPKNEKKPAGQIASHGWDNINKEMHGIFLAKGPNIRPCKKPIKSFQNIHIYPLVSNILGLASPEHLDGKTSVLKPLLKK